MKQALIVLVLVLLLPIYVENKDSVAPSQPIGQQAQLAA